jgi:regulation of enolase protein 1 (concanavalin A-like superfamily)
VTWFYRYMNSSKARLAVVVYDSLEALGRIRLGFNHSLVGYLCLLLAFSISLLGSGADLTITQSHAGGFLPGETQASNTISVMNAGTGPTTGMVSVSDSVPSTLTPASIAGQGWTCVQPSGPCTRMDVLYPRVFFPDLTRTVAVAPDAPSTVVNTVTVSQDGKTTSSRSDPTTITAASAGAPVSDDVTAATLNTAIWTFANPQNDGTFALNGSSLLLSVPAGKSHDVWTNGYYGVRLMQAIADADFDVEVKFGSGVSIQSPYQQQGLLVEQDPANFLRFSIYSDEQRTFLFAASILDGFATVRVSQEIRGGGAIYMRVNRIGTNWRFSYSYDSLHWTPAFLFSAALHVAMIGPYAGNGQYNGAPAPAFTAVVDHFVSRPFPPPIVDGRPYPPEPSPPSINVWYGDTQTFGQNGKPQKWVNILGDVSDFDEVISLTYSLNDGPELPLWMGENEFRLVSPGEFNIELDYSLLTAGTNSLRIKAVDTLGYQAVHFVTVNYVQGQTWPRDYSIDWSRVSSIESVAQVVDGRWQLQDGAVRTIETGYDRFIVVGGQYTWEQFVASVEVTINSMDGFGFAVGLVAGWQGHLAVPFGEIPLEHPNPYPAFSGYSRAYPYPPSLRIHGNTSAAPEYMIAQDISGRRLQIGVKYIFKLQAQDNGLGGSHYRFKVWPSASVEPSEWDLEGDADLSRGSIGLIANRANVSFGAVMIKSL